MTVVTLTKATEGKNDPPMRRQSVCEIQSTGTISPSKETHCLVKRLNCNKSNL